MNIKTPEFNRMRTIFFFGLIIILGLALLYIFQPFLYAIFWAAIITVLFHPLYYWFNRHLKMPNLSAIIILLLVILIIFVPLAMISTLIVNESLDLYRSVSNWNVGNQVQGLADWLSHTRLAPFVETIQNQWTKYAADVAKTISLFLFNNIKSITQNSIRLVFMLFIMFYALFFFLKDGEGMLRKLMRLSPLGNQYEKMLYEKFTSTARATLKGNLIVGLIQGTLGGITFWIAGVQGALIWGTIMVLLSLIPAVGSAIVWLPTGIILLAFGLVWQGLLVLLVGVFIISTIDNLIRPPLVGKDIQMHPLIILFSSLGGIIAFGISGFVVGPVIAALFVAVMEIYDYHFRSELDKN